LLKKLAKLKLKLKNKSKRKSHCRQSRKHRCSKTTKLSNTTVHKISRLATT